MIEILEKNSITSQKGEAIQKMTVEKAKSHINKVQKIVEDHKQSFAEKTESMKHDIESKLMKADANRE